MVDVLHHLVAIINYLAERNMALRGAADTLNKPDNEVELLAKFDPVKKEYRVESGASSHTHYLGKIIQNELIDSISLWMRSKQ